MLYGWIREQARWSESCVLIGYPKRQYEPSLSAWDFQPQARNQDFMWGGANEAKADPTTEMYFLSSDPFI